MSSSSRLPNLSNLSLHCAPCGVPFERWDDALRDEESKKHPRYKFWTRGDTCGICGAPLEDKAGLGDETRDVEALTEKLTCGHVFHRTCLQESIKAGGRICPLADRTPIAQEVLDRLHVPGFVAVLGLVLERRAADGAGVVPLPELVVGMLLGLLVAQRVVPPLKRHAARRAVQRQV